MAVDLSKLTPIWDELHRKNAKSTLSYQQRHVFIQRLYKADPIALEEFYRVWAKSLKIKPRQLSHVKHPGSVLCDVLGDRGFNLTLASTRLAYSLRFLSAVFENSAPITPKLALRLHENCILPYRYWADLQHDYDQMSFIILSTKGALPQTTKKFPI